MKSAKSITFGHDGRKRRLRAGNVLRISAAGVVVLMSVSYAQTHLIQTVGTDGILTGPIYRITAPIDGIVAQAPIRMGQVVPDGARLFRLRDPAADDRTLERLKADVAAKRRELQGVRRRLDKLDGVSERLDLQVKRHRRITLTRLATLIDETESELDAARARLRETRSRAGRLDKLDADLIRRTRVEKAVRARDVAQAEIQRLKARLTRLRAERKGARKGVFFSNGFYDSPYSQQRLHEIELRRIALEDRKIELAGQVASLRQRLRAETDRTARLRAQTLDSPSRGVIWTQNADTGSKVRKGQELAEIAGCENLLVEVRLNEDRIGDITLGEPVRVQLKGSEADLSGHVRSVRGSGSMPRPALRAANFDDREADTMTVAVGIGRQPLRDVLGQGCHVGRAARVYFDGASDPWLETAPARGRELMARMLDHGEWLVAYTRRHGSDLAARIRAQFAPKGETPAAPADRPQSAAARDASDP